MNRVDENEKFIVRDPVASYRKLSTREFEERLLWAEKMLSNCRCCPRNCGVNRLKGEVGFCTVGRHVRISSAFPHFGEESCLVGRRGSGTIFFSGCNLRCVFCQNYDISQRIDGKEIDSKSLALLMLDLQDLGVHNINLVSPSHVVPQIMEAIYIAAQQGLILPIVYNTNAYDNPETIELLNGIVDIYMPDFKLWRRSSCREYLGSEDYREIACRSICKMYSEVGDLKFTSDGLAFRGLLIRHLVMPGLLNESKAIVSWIAKSLSSDTYINIMDQYYPANKVGKRLADGRIAYPELNRRVSREEWRELLCFARRLGLYRFAD